MTTGNDICIQALKKAGIAAVGQPALAEDINDAFTDLNDMLAQWQRQRWLIWHLIDLSVVSTGAISYTVGPGGQINTNTQYAWGLLSLLPNAGGGGYAVGDTITLAGGSFASQGVATVTTIGGGGAVTSVTVPTTPGQYTAPLPTAFTQQATSGAGIGATFQTPTWERMAFAPGVGQRPDRLESAFLRQLVQSQPNNVDYPLDLIESRETYNLIALKSLMSFPGAVFYDSSFPLGQIHCYPVPNANIFEIHITIKEQLNQIANLATPVNLPLEYFAAIKFNLAQRLRMAYDLPPKMDLARLAKSSLNIIRNANAQIPRLTMPVDIIRPRLYNIYSDRTY